MPASYDIAVLEVQLRLARNALAAAESGLFSPSATLLAKYRADVLRLERELSRLRD